VNEREFTRLVDPSFVCIPLTNAQLHLTKRKCRRMVRQLSKDSEAQSDEIVTAMSTACGASIVLFELFKKKPRTHLLS